MSDGFHVRSDRLRSHGQQVSALADTVDTGAQAEMAGISPADFGVVIGPIVGTGLAALGGMAALALKGVSAYLDDTGTQLVKTADDYDGHESITTDLIRVVLV